MQLSEVQFGMSIKQMCIFPAEASLVCPNSGRGHPAALLAGAVAATEGAGEEPCPGVTSAWPGSAPQALLSSMSSCSSCDRKLSQGNVIS